MTTPKEARQISLAAEWKEAHDKARDRIRELEGERDKTRARIKELERVNRWKAPGAYKRLREQRDLWRERALVARREYHKLRAALQAAQNWARKESYQSDDYTEGYPPEGTCTWCLASPAEECWDGCPGDVVAAALGNGHE